MSVWNQLLASAVLSTVCISIGMLHAWPSSTIALFCSENTTLSRPMTATEKSLFGSLSSIGTMIATPLFGYLLDKLGRKKLTIYGALMHVLTWTIRIAFRNVEMILLSCLTAGVGACVAIVVIVFIGEYTQESIRGSLMSTPVAAAFVGMLISYWIGGTLSYYTVTYICLSIDIVAVLTITFLKESPTYLMRNGLEEEAAKSIAFYRHIKVDSNEVIQELITIRRTLNQNLDGDKSLESEQLNTESTTATTCKKLSTWQFIKKSKSSQRAFGICLMVGVLSIFQGLIVVQTYAAPLFKEAVPSISTTLCTVLLAVVSLISAVTSGYFVDIAGRKTLLMYASLVAGLCCTLLGVQLQTSWGPPWLVPVFIYLYCAAFTVGPCTVPFVLIGELFLPEIKGLASVLIVEANWLSTFILLYVYDPLVNLIGLSQLFYIFTAVCLAAATFTFFMLPETKGLPVAEIQLLFDKREAKSVKHIKSNLQAKYISIDITK